MCVCVCVCVCVKKNQNTTQCTRFHLEVINTILFYYMVTSTPDSSQLYDVQYISYASQSQPQIVLLVQPQRITYPGRNVCIQQPYLLVHISLKKKKKEEVSVQLMVVHN
jgi:hypothetical protein